MSEKAQRNEMTLKGLVYDKPGTDATVVRADLPYGDEGRPFDLYLPPGDAPGGGWPAVLIVAGYPDPGFERFMGCRLKEMECYRAWARLAAASGMAGVLYSAVRPEADLAALLASLRADGASLGLDPKRIALWASSGNAPTDVAALISDPDIRTAALCYSYLLDLDGDSTVAAAAAQFGFANPAAGRSVEDLPPTLPLLIVRAGGDSMPGLNGTIDRFTVKALERNLPLTVINLPTAPHAFDLLDESESSRRAIEGILDFLRFQLRA